MSKNKDSHQIFLDLVNEWILEAFESSEAYQERIWNSKKRKSHEDMETFLKDLDEVNFYVNG